ncbi:hypothetical protein [Parafrankia sp. EUN1f]|uniref:hypothetical protein n=1 Tax=Parafrankia sp. EUN1f TaxID=102897 RepID=UPI0001C468D2|nr:hypothetical protein [Parafrankia sp. EUN1f]EFC80418.1 hypothetical protein FrEUN1fDRAFT_6471 [Parafrankia sp. EUN1f]
MKTIFVAPQVSARPEPVTDPPLLPAAGVRPAGTGHRPAASSRRTRPFGARAAVGRDPRSRLARGRVLGCGTNGSGGGPIRAGAVRLGG